VYQPAFRDRKIIAAKQFFCLIFMQLHNVLILNEGKGEVFTFSSPQVDLLDIFDMFFNFRVKSSGFVDQSRPLLSVFFLAKYVHWTCDTARSLNLSGCPFCATEVKLDSSF
jgi:hypothetical protein